MSKVSNYKQRRYEVVSRYLTYEHGQRTWRTHQRELTSSKKDAKELAEIMERSVKRKISSELGDEYKITITPYSKLNSYLYRP